MESADEMLSALLGDNPQLAALKKLITEKPRATRFSWKRLCRCCFDEGGAGAQRKP